MKILRLLIGTYEEKGGIWEVQLDLDSKRILLCEAATQSRRNSYLSVQGNVCYAVSEIPLAEWATGELSSWRIMKNGLKPIHSLKHLPCLLPHLCVNKSGTVVYTVSYGTGEILAIEVSDGIFGDVISYTRNSGDSVNPRRQSSAHPHSVWLSQDEKYLYLCDLGTDEILCWPLDEKGRICTAQKKSLSLPAGYGPRHMVFDTDGIHAWVLCELCYHVLELEIQADGSLVISKDISLENDIPREEQGGGAIRLGIDNTLYCSNRSENHSRIDQLSIKEGKRGNCLTQCQWPRDFALTADGKILICGNQTDNSISIFQKNEENEMEFYWKIPGIPTPVCVAVLENEY